MKLEKPAPPNAIRLQIVKQGEKTEYLSLYECTADEVESHIKDIVKDKVSLFPQGKTTTVNIREAKEGKNGKGQSFKFYGLAPKEVIVLLIKSLEK